jgi:predicted RecA/RadA family phage recombinase
MAQTQTPTLFFKGSYQTMDYTPDSAVYAGDVILINDGAFVAPAAIEANALGVLAREGGRWIGPNGGHGFAVNDTVYWDAEGNPVGGTAATGAITRVASGNTKIGVCTKAAIATDPGVEFALNTVGETTS